MSSENPRQADYLLYAPANFVESNEVASVRIELEKLMSSEYKNTDFGKDCRRRLHSRLRAARLIQSRISGCHSHSQWIDMCDEFDNKCVRCGAGVIGRPTKDHIIPICVGGSDSIDNIQPLCRQCNSGKTDFIDWKSYRRDHGWGK